MLNKKLFALIVAVIILILGIVVVVGLRQDSKNTGKPGVSTETDKEKDEPYNGVGLEIMDEVDETVDSVDVPDDWDGTSGDSNDKTQSDEVNKEDADDKGDTDEEEKSDEDILIDDKVWGEPS